MKDEGGKEGEREKGSFGYRYPSPTLLLHPFLMCMSAFDSYFAWTGAWRVRKEQNCVREMSRKGHKPCSIKKDDQKKAEARSNKSNVDREEKEGGGR